MVKRNATVSLKPGKSRAALTITHPNAAGIDIGSASQFVTVPLDRDDETCARVSQLHGRSQRSG